MKMLAHVANLSQNLVRSLWGGGARPFRKGGIMSFRKGSVWPWATLVLAIALLVSQWLPLGINVGRRYVPIVTVGVVNANVSADYTLTGTDDNNPFQNALDSLPATGGVLQVVSTATINWHNGVTVTRAINNVTIMGTGLGTFFDGDGITPIFTVGGNNWKFVNLRTDAASGIAGLAAGCQLDNVLLGATYYDHWGQAGQSVFNDVTVASLTDSGLTPNGVPIAGVGGLLSSNANLTFSGTTLTSTNITTGAIKDTALTNGRVPIVGTGGLLGDSVNLTWANPSLNVGGGNVTRTATYVVAASNAPAHVKAQADYVCDGTADQVLMQAPIDTIFASGVRGKVLYIGTFTCSAGITPRSNVDVELQGEIDFNYVAPGFAMTFNDMTNSVWSGGIIKRQGIIAPAGQAGVLYIRGTTNDTVQFWNMKVVSEITEGTWEMDGVIQVDGDAYPTLGNIDIYDSPNATGVFTAALGLGGSGKTHCINVRAYAGGGTVSIGIHTFNWSQPILDNCEGHGSNTVGSGNHTYGVGCWDTSAPVFNGGMAEGGGASMVATGITAGVYMGTGEQYATFNGFTAIGGIGNGTCQNYAWYLEDSAVSPILNSCIGRPPTSTQWFRYTSANNGRFRPFASRKYQLISIYVYCWVSAGIPGGRTLNLGTTPGGTEIASGIPLADGAIDYFDFTKVCVAADGYMYCTIAGGAVPEDSFFVGYTAAYNCGGQGALLVDTVGNARINNSSFYSPRDGITVQIAANACAHPHWRMSNCYMENYTPDTGGNPALYTVSPILDTPIYNSTIVSLRQIVGVGSFGGQNVGAPILPGEVKVAQGSLVPGGANAIAFGWANPSITMMVQKVVVEIYTPGGTPGSEIQVGLADDITGLNLGTEFFNTIDANSVAIRDSWTAGDNGTQTKEVLCWAAGAGTDRCVIGKILTQPAASLAGKYYIFYVGR